MNFEIENNDKYTLVRSKVERLDSTVAPELKSELVVLSGNAVSNIILDLSETRYCDSSGLSAVLVANRLCRTVNGCFVLTGLQDHVQKLITISQLDSVLNITPTVDEAVDYLFMSEVEKDLDSNE